MKRYRIMYKGVTLMKMKMVDGKINIEIELGQFEDDALDILNKVFALIRLRENRIVKNVLALVGKKKDVKEYENIYEAIDELMNELNNLDGVFVEMLGEEGLELVTDPERIFG